MTITLFVEPSTLSYFEYVNDMIKMNEDDDIDGGFCFNPKDISFSEAMISNWLWINMELDEYDRLKRAIKRNS